MYIFLRYFNAWVESGRLHIQTEFCEGGSLEAKAWYLRPLWCTNTISELLIVNCKGKRLHRVRYEVLRYWASQDFDPGASWSEWLCIVLISWAFYLLSLFLVRDWLPTRWPAVCSTCTRRSSPIWTSSPPTSSSPSANLRRSCHRLSHLASSMLSGRLLIPAQVIFRWFSWLIAA